MKKLQIYATLICGSLVTGCIFAMDQCTTIDELAESLWNTAAENSVGNKKISPARKLFDQKKTFEAKRAILTGFNKTHELGYEKAIDKLLPPLSRSNSSASKKFKYKRLNGIWCSTLQECNPGPDQSNPIIMLDLQTNLYTFDGQTYTNEEEATEAAKRKNLAQLNSMNTSIATIIQSPLAKMLVVAGALYAIYRYYVKTEIKSDQENAPSDEIVDTVVASPN